MALAIDADREPRVRLDADLSAEAAQRLHDILTAVLADLEKHAGIETTWPLLRMLTVLEAASSSGPAPG